MVENKTKPTKASVESYFAAIRDDARRDDCEALAKLMANATGEKATMWGPSILGFGSHHYKYASGREGDMCRIGFSPRAQELVLYGGFLRNPARLARLGKYRAGKGCLYVRRLADVDEGELEAMAGEAWVREREISDGC